MDLLWLCWQRSEVSIRHECWRLPLIAAVFLACARRTSDFSCCAFRITQFPNIKIGNASLLHSNCVFSAQKEACARLTWANERQGAGVLLPELFPQKAMEGRGHVLGSMAEPACRAVAPLPRALQAALSFTLTFTTMLVLGFSSTNPAGSLAKPLYTWEGKQRRSRFRYCPSLPPFPTTCHPTWLHTPKCSLFWGIHGKGRAAGLDAGRAQSRRGIQPNICRQLTAPPLQGMLSVLLRFWASKPFDYPKQVISQPWLAVCWVDHCHVSSGNPAD